MGDRAGAAPAKPGALKSPNPAGRSAAAPAEAPAETLPAVGLSSPEPRPESRGSADSILANSETGEETAGGSVGLEWSAVHLADHDPAWIGLFEEEKTRIRSAIGGAVRDIQHVGSTAVPGLRAKPVIDIAVGIDSLKTAAALISPLESIGYQYHPEIRIPGELFLRKAGGTHHLHLLEHQSSYWADYLSFRDHLRQDPAAARRYLELKTDLARQFSHDRPSYTRGKAEFIQAILAEAGK